MFIRDPAEVAATRKSRALHVERVKRMRREAAEIYAANKNSNDLFVDELLRPMPFKVIVSRVGGKMVHNLVESGKE